MNTYLELKVCASHENIVERFEFIEDEIMKLDVVIV